jgi:hypothetical protein
LEPTSSENTELPLVHSTREVALAARPAAEKHSFVGYSQLLIIHARADVGIVRDVATDLAQKHGIAGLHGGQAGFDDLAGVGVVISSEERASSLQQRR